MNRLGIENSNRVIFCDGTSFDIDGGIWVLSTGILSAWRTVLGLLKCCNKWFRSKFVFIVIDLRLWFVSSSAVLNVRFELELFCSEKQFKLLVVLVNGDSVFVQLLWHCKMSFEFAVGYVVEHLLDLYFNGDVFDCEYIEFNTEYDWRFIEFHLQVLDLSVKWQIVVYLTWWSYRCLRGNGKTWIQKIWMISMKVMSRSFC